MNYVLSIERAKDALVLALRSELVPFLIGSPGIGKSAIVAEVAEAYNLKLIDFRLAQAEPVDLNGYPHIDEKTDKATYIPFDIFPIEGDVVPKGYEGWLVFLDELNGADPSVMKASYKLLRDRMVGQRKLHPKAFVVGAGNHITDGGLVDEMPSTLVSRMCMIPVQADAEQWIKYATKEGYDHRITSYLSWREEHFYTHKPETTGESFACPRTWTDVNKVLIHGDITSPTTQDVIKGSISVGVAVEFLAFCQLESELVQIKDILNSPETCPVPTDPGTLYMMTGSLSYKATPDNLETLMKYVNRLPPEFQVVCMRDMQLRHPEFLSHDSFQEWFAKNGADLF